MPKHDLCILNDEWQLFYLMRYRSLPHEQKQQQPKFLKIILIPPSHCLLSNSDPHDKMDQVILIAAFSTKLNCGKA